MKNNFFTRLAHSVKRNKSEIAIIAGSIVSTVSAVWAIVRTHKNMEELQNADTDVKFIEAQVSAPAEEREPRLKEAKIARVKEYVKTYALPAATYAAGMGGIAYGTVTGHNKRVSLEGQIGSLTAAYLAYRASVKEKYGTDADKEIVSELASDGGDNVLATDAAMFDIPFTPRYFSNYSGDPNMDYMTIRNICYTASMRLRDGDSGTQTVFDIYDHLGADWDEIEADYPNFRRNAQFFGWVQGTPAGQEITLVEKDIDSPDHQYHKWNDYYVLSPNIDGHLETELDKLFGKPEIQE